MEHSCFLEMSIVDGATTRMRLKQSFKIGSHRANDIVIQGVPPVCAVLYPYDDTYNIRSVSLGLVFLNSESFEDAKLEDGDQIMIQSVRFDFKTEVSESVARLAQDHFFFFSKKCAIFLKKCILFPRKMMTNRFAIDAERSCILNVSWIVLDVVEFVTAAGHVFAKRMGMHLWIGNGNATNAIQSTIMDHVLQKQILLKYQQMMML